MGPWSSILLVSLVVVYFARQSVMQQAPPKFVACGVKCH
jgi:hypothetical protein